MYFCPPPSKRNNGEKEADDRCEAERINKVRSADRGESALGESYKIYLHYAVAQI